MQTIILLLQIK